MKTLSKILLFVFVIFPPENFSQGSIIVNGWKLFLKPEIDFQKTTSFLGNDGKIFYQTFWLTEKPQ